jgi:hypothetical protein
MSLRKNDEKDPKRRFADYVWNLTQIEAELSNLTSLIATAQAGIVAVPAIATAWPIGSVFLSVLATNPATLLGFGTWTQIASGQFLVGQKATDVDFDTAEEAGGAKTHKHKVDPPETNASTPVGSNMPIGTGANTASQWSHYHTVNIAEFDSETVSNVPPYFVCYVWKRTA